MKTSAIRFPITVSESSERETMNSETSVMSMVFMLNVVMGTDRCADNSQCFCPALTFQFESLAVLKE